MARSRFFREDFDRERNFVCFRPFVFMGQAYIPGQSIDKTLFTVRRLRLLYDGRFLEYGPTVVTEPTPPPEPTPAVVPRRRHQPPVMKPAVPRRRRQVFDGVSA